jgi:hypothetical protein
MLRQFRTLALKAIWIASAAVAYLIALDAVNQVVP